MNPSSLIKLTFARYTATALLGGLMLLNTATSHASVLYSCPGGAGDDFSSRGFYMPSYPGITLDSATLKLLGYSPGTYQVSLTVRSNTYNGPVLGVSTVTVALNALPGAKVSATFPFASVPMPKGGVVCFILGVVSGPYPNIYYDTSAFAGGCPEVIETEDTTPPLSTFRRYGVNLTLTGALGTITPGWSIQAAINAAVPGETVFVGAGTYHENLYLRSGISVVGSGFNSTFLQGTGDVRVVNSIGVTNSRFAGFKITGSGTSIVSAAVWIAGGNLMLDDNWILGNTNGVWINPGSSPIVRNNLIERSGNPPTSGDSAGIVCQNSTPLITGNLIVNSLNEGIRCEAYGGPLTGAQIINNTIVGTPNYAIGCFYGATPTIKNNIIATNGSGIIAGASTGSVSSFNDLWANSVANYGGTAAPGPGDLALDPLFDSTSPSRFALAIGSPCIHAGDPNPIYNNLDGTRNTMGAYGGSSAMSPGLITSLTSGFLFNSIGSIPASSISTTLPRTGLANVDAGTANALQIPAWEDAPFGGLVQLHGLFGSSDIAVQYYQILGAKWNGNTPPAPADFVPVLDPLSKIKYTIGTNGLVMASLVNVGPDANGLYLRTDRPDSGYWTSPDLKLLLNTVALQNSRYDFICRAYTNDTLSSLVTLTSNSLNRVTLWIDNNGVVVNLAHLLDQHTNIISECGIIPLATARQNLQFEFTAYHPSGFLHSFSLGSYYGRNHFGGTIATDQYAVAHDGSGPLWPGVGPGTVFSNSLPAQVAGSLADWQTCAYQFHLLAVARTTDGVNRIYWNTFDDHYFLNVGPPVGSCLGDLNGDGRVDGADLAIFGQRFGTNCASPNP